VRIEILGTGCARCEALAANAKAAADELGIACELCKVTDLNEIMKRGVMITPALAIEGEVKVSGRVPDESELATILRDSLS